MNTTRRFPRTLEQAFGPNRWPISGPYRRQSPVPRMLKLAAAALVLACMLMAGA